MKILNWNIRSGGGKNIERILECISVHNPDVLVLTEFRRGKEIPLSDGLRKGGFQWIETSKPKDKENGILVASKREFVPSEIGSHEEDPQRWLPLYWPTFGIHVVAVHVPGSPDHKFIDGVGIAGGVRKKMFWEHLIECATKNLDERIIFVGDFNTGLREDAEGAPFLLSRYMKDLVNMGYVDAWRAIHKNEREFTWYSQRKIEGVTKDFNGFRLDYVFVSPSLSSWVTNAYHSHDERTQNISDHSAVICELAPSSVPDEVRELSELEEAERQYKWALGVLDDPNASDIDKARAKPIVEAQQRIWAKIDARLDDIMDIEDEAERETAWDAWEQEDLDRGTENVS